jgi:hypothetical protein
MSQKVQVNLGLQEAELANRIDTIIETWRLQLRDAGWAKLGKGEMAAGTLEVAGEAFSRWLVGPLGLKDWKLLTKEARKELLKQKMQANINEILQEMMVELTRAMEPYVQKILDDGDFKAAMKGIHEKHDVQV